MLFGNDSAEDDDLLLECEVDQSVELSARPVVTGRWGTGKSASLILGTKTLSEALRGVDSEFDRIWLIDERSIDSKALVAHFGRQSDARLFAAQLRQLWKGEILRRMSLILATLREQNYRSLSGDHWTYVMKAKQSSSFWSSLWSQLPNIAKILSQENSTRFESIESLKGDVEEIFSDHAERAIRSCLWDIKKLPSSKALSPIVAIEPIDTPNSALEDEASLANEVVSSLLNVFLEVFKVSQRQPIEVRLAIPWHRITNQRLTFPHKLQSYTTRLTWKPDELRAFINRRILWEFRRVGRTFSEKGTRDPWGALFESEVRNGRCSPVCFEDSFSYVLRHTHHRPRDVQQIARLAVFYAASDSRRSVDDVLHCRGGQKVGGKSLVQAVHEFCRDGADFLIVEAGRRIPGLRNVAERLRNVSVPFSIDDLEQRLMKDSSGDSVSDAIRYLWDAGIIGVQKVLLGGKGRQRVFPDENRAEFRNKNNAVFQPYYFFYYNYENENIESLLEDDDPSIETSLILHPRTYEIFFPKIQTLHPIGI